MSTLNGWTNLKIIDLLTLETIKLELDAVTKQDIIEELVDLVDRAGLARNRDLVLKDVIAREKKLSTGLELGLAVPHAKSDGVDRLVGAFGMKKNGVNFDAIDGKPTHFFFLMVSPNTPPGPHIKGLSQLAKFMRLDGTRKQLLSSTRREDLIGLFSEAHLDPAP